MRDKDFSRTEGALIIYIVDKKVDKLMMILFLEQTVDWLCNKQWIGIAVGMAIGIAVGIAIVIAIGIAVGIVVGIAIGIVIEGYEKYYVRTIKS